MTDRELLELAAKAAGIDGKWVRRRFGNADGWSDYFVVGPRVGKLWNPLTDDGDALRLAVKLKINIEHVETLGGKPHGVNGWPVGRGDCAWVETDVGDYAAATRRAIVRAAAEMGKA